MKTPDSQQKQPRLLIAGAPGLPDDFVVFEADDVFDACDEARITFMANPGVSLVVWSNAPAIFNGSPSDEQQQALKDAVRNLSVSVRDARKQIKTKIKLYESLWDFSMNTDPIEDSIQRHFHSIADFTGANHAILQDWQRSTTELTDALSESLIASKMVLSTRFQSSAYNTDGTHIDNGLRTNSLRVLRVVDGDTPRFYSRHDVAGLKCNRGFMSAQLKEAAQPWTIKPWDIAFVSQRVAHEGPYGVATDRRAIEVYNVSSSEEFVAVADRPFFRIPFSRPAFAEIDV